MLWKPFRFCPGRSTHWKRSKATRSFLQKRTKKLLSVSDGTEFSVRTPCRRQWMKVFCFFFSKKKRFACCFSFCLPGRLQGKSQKTFVRWGEWVYFVAIT